MSILDCRIIIQLIDKLSNHTFKTNTGDIIFVVRVTLKAMRKGDRKVIMYDATFCILFITLCRLIYDLM